MGIDSERMGRLSLWQYNAMCKGWDKANQVEGEKPEPPTYEEFKRFMDAPVGGYRD